MSGREEASQPEPKVLDWDAIRAMEAEYRLLEKALVQAVKARDAARLRLNDLVEQIEDLQKKMIGAMQFLKNPHRLYDDEEETPPRRRRRRSRKQRHHDEDEDDDPDF